MYVRRADNVELYLAKGSCFDRRGKLAALPLCGCEVPASDLNPEISQ
jgi:hypothetical protein